MCIRDRDSAIKIEDFLRELVDKKIISAESRACFVNDGSNDSTWDLLEHLCETNAFLCAISLAGNRGHQNAMLAGMMMVKDRCDAVITLDADLQHDISVIPEFITQYKKGYEVVYGAVSYTHLIMLESILHLPLTEITGTCLPCRLFDIFWKWRKMISFL